MVAMTTNTSASVTMFAPSNCYGTSVPCSLLLWTTMLLMKASEEDEENELLIDDDDDNIEEQEDSDVWE